MTRNTLLAATALTAMVAAGGANASDIRTNVGGVANAGVTSTPYQLAQETNATTAVPLTGALVITALTAQTGGTANANAVSANTQYLMTFALTGGAYNAALSGANLVATGGTACTPTINLQSGGAAGSTSVTYVVTTPGTCTTPDTTFTLTANLRMAANNAVSSSFTLATATNITLDNTPISRTTVASVNGYLPFVTATVDSAAGGVDNADWATVAAITGTTPYTSFLTDGSDADGPNDRILGAVGIQQVNNNTRPTHTDLAGTATVTTAPYVLAVTTPVAGVTLSGGNSDTFTNAALPTTAITESLNIFANAVGGTTQIAGGSAVVSVTPQAIAGLTVDGVVSGSLESITLEGTNFVAPWIQMQNTSSQSIIRISNQGTTATGPITLRLRAPNAGTVFNTCVVTQGLLTAGTLVGGGIAADSFISINGNTLANACFGTTAQNADVQITIQANATNLTAKVRNVTANGDVSEQSLGRLRDAPSVAF